MTSPQVVDYYSALNLPHDADLTGIENAYARISDELAGLTDLDSEFKDALRKVNEAYAVLSKPELRRDYDAVFLAEERAREARRREAVLRRRAWAQRAIIAALLLVVIGQAALLAYIGWDDISSALRSAGL